MCHTIFEMVPISQLESTLNFRPKNTGHVLLHIPVKVLCGGSIVHRGLSTNQFTLLIYVHSRTFIRYTQIYFYLRFKLRYLSQSLNRYNIYIFVNVVNFGQYAFTILIYYILHYTTSFVIYMHDSQEFFTFMETSPLLMKGCKI